MEPERAFAKLNLCLSVVGRAGALHALDMLTAAIDLADVLTVEEDDCAPSVVFGAGSAEPPDVDPRDCNALRAIAGMARLCGRKGARIRIEKHIPDRLGLGGSSAEAAGILRLLGRLWGIAPDDPRVLALAATLGSDVPGILGGGFRRIGGCGEIVRRVPSACAPTFVLAARGGASTGAVYAKFDALGCPFGAALDAEEADLRAGRLPRLRNDLTQAAIAVEPSIGDTLAALRALGLPCGMTGSGACCFAAAPDEKTAHTVAKTLSAPFVAVVHPVP